MGRGGTTAAISLLVLIANINSFGWWGILTAALLLTFPLYLIWVDSKRPFEQQFRFENSKLAKKIRERNERERLT